MENEFTVRIAKIEDPFIYDGRNGTSRGARITFEIGLGEFEKYTCPVFFGEGFDAADYVRIARHFFRQRLSLFLEETKDWELSDDEVNASFRG